MDFFLICHAKIFRLFYLIYPSDILKKILKIFKISWEVTCGNVTHYPKSVINFEKDFANYIGREFGLSFCNGTSSIDAALFSMEISAGDEILVQSHTFHASIDPIVNAGAKPIFVDVNQSGLSIDLEDLKSKISTKTKCIIVVHLFGIPSNVEAVSEIARQNNLYLLEDCSHSHGASVGERKVGSFGDIACFSLQGEKAVAAGEGGIAVTNRKEFFTRMSMYGHFKRHADLFEEKYKKYSETGIGVKLRAHPLGIAMASIDLKFLDYYNKNMNRNLIRLKNIFDNYDWIKFCSNEDSHLRGGGFYGGVPILIDTSRVSRKEVIKSFALAGIEMRKYPFKMHHKMEMFVQDDEKVELPNTEKLKNNMLLVDRKLLSFQPSITRSVIKNVLEKIEKKLK